MVPPLRVTLDQAAHDELDRRYQSTRDATTRTRYQMILLRAEGHPVVEVAQLTRCSPDTVRRVLKRYLGGGPDAVPHRPISGSRPTTRLLGRPSWSGSPTATRAVWVPSALWRCRLLADYLQRVQRVTGHAAGIETVRIALRRAGFVCKRPRWVLTRKAHAQPGWAKNA
jgi:transposase